ncbi:MAG: S8 family serine peptidase [Candidatus Cloacimonetes bacterium]|nr:S8 family serine peptidase [Candidatus Cloacimonadota bacterium]
MKLRHVLLTFTVLVIVFSVQAIELEKGTADLNDALRKIESSEEMLPVIVIMKEQYDSDLLYNQIRTLDRRMRRDYTITTLQQFSESTQAGITRELATLEREGLVENLSYLWVTNAITLRANREALVQLDKRADIDRILYDPIRQVLIGDDFRFESGENIFTSDDDDVTRDIVYNVNIMNVPDVWDQGFYGQGVVVAVLDTGVNYNHADITNQMWTDPNYPNHGYNFVNNTHNTLDDHGHGTHCAGTVAGNGASGTQTGVAPQSQIMALKVLDSGGGGQESGVWNAIQFSITHGADVMSLSLGWLHAWNPDRNSWRSIMTNALTAGLVASVAAGNEGSYQNNYPIPDNVRTPGDCPPPWLHPDQTLIGGLSAVITIGATNSSDQVANFSSRGPVTWQNVGMYNDYPYNPGIGLIRPDVVAPGVDVVSLRHNNNWGYTSMSGTSMAAPNAAGVMALMLSKDPLLLPEDISQILEETANALHTTKSNISGSGRIDALSAIDLIVAENPPHPPINPHPAVGALGVPLIPTLSWTNGGGALIYFVNLGTDNPPTNVLYEFMTPDLSIQVPLQLEHSTTYYWQVFAMNNFGQTPSEVWSFTTGLPISEDFETGDFTEYEWDFLTAGNVAQEWHITSNESFSGTYSARSGQVGDSALTTLQVTIEVTEPGIISFYRKVSTEENDFLRFLINNSIQGFWSGEEDWTPESFYVEAGVQTFRWMYIKNPLDAGGQDAVWIDDITFPPHVYNVVNSPENLQYELDLEYILLEWELEQLRDPLFLGFNIYQALGEQSNYELLNQEPVQETEYHVLITNAGDHSFYVTALYDTAESDPSEIVELTIEPAIEEPFIDPPGGEFTSPVMVSIDCQEPDVYIFYTTDGEDPTCDCTPYDEPIEIAESLTLKIRLYKEGHLPSEVFTYEFEITTSVEDDVLLKPTDLKVYPNPFVMNNPQLKNSRTLNIDFSLAHSNEVVKIDIYNIKGQLVRSFQPQIGDQQSYSINWDMKAHNGRDVGSGIYLIRMSAGKEVLTRRVMVVK